MAGEWAVYRTKPFGKTYGYCLPLFCKDYSFGLDSVGIYSDGLWDYRLYSIFPSYFTEDVAEGRAAVFPSAGAKFFFTLMGYGTVTDAEWTVTTDGLVRRADELFHSLNPSLQNLVTKHPDGFFRSGKPHWSVALRYWLRRGFRRQETEKQEDTAFILSVQPDTTAYYVNAEGGEVAGISLPIFANQKGAIYLTRWFLFTDGMSRIGGDGAMMTEGEANELWANGALFMNAPPNVWIHVEGLGQFRSADAYWWVKPAECQKEARDEIDMLNGAPGAQATCIQNWEAYEADPTEANKEALRLAYEAVPEHKQAFCGHDMDAKDWPIRRILGLGARNY